MPRLPHICIRGRFVPLRPTHFTRAGNDTLRAVALCVPAANENHWFGGRAS